ncbi:MAG: hypothetical protein RL653_3112 [Pseudomonadota bacterium]|jgi:hypothetical protein
MISNRLPVRAPLTAQSHLVRTAQAPVQQRVPSAPTQPRAPRPAAPSELQGLFSQVMDMLRNMLSSLGLGGSAGQGSGGHDNGSVADGSSAGTSQGAAQDGSAPVTDGSSPTVTDGSSPSKVFVLGNQRRPRTLKSLIEHARKAGANIDIGKFSKEDLNRKVASGRSLVVSADGKILDEKATADIKANKGLGVAGHLEKRGVGDNENTVSRKGPETLGRGGQLDVGGSSYEVENTFLKSPVALDLTGDGRIGTTGVSTAQKRVNGQVGRTVQFDVDGDGTREHTEWMSGGDGLLVDDRDGGASAAMRTGKDINGKRLFGDQGGAFANGYDKLATLDANRDGKLAGKELAGLKVWVDDGDAKLEKGELKSLAELGVSEVSTRMHTEKNARGETLMRSDFVRNGRRQMTEDVWFATRPIVG